MPAEANFQQENQGRLGVDPSEVHPETVEWLESLEFPKAVLPANIELLTPEEVLPLVERGVNWLGIEVEPVKDEAGRLKKVNVWERNGKVTVGSTFYRNGYIPGGSPDSEALLAFIAGVIRPLFGM